MDLFFGLARMYPHHHQPITTTFLRWTSSPATLVCKHAPHAKRTKPPSDEAKVRPSSTPNAHTNMCACARTHARKHTHLYYSNHLSRSRRGARLRRRDQRSNIMFGPVTLSRGNPCRQTSVGPGTVQYCEQICPYAVTIECDGGGHHFNYESGRPCLYKQFPRHSQPQPPTTTATITATTANPHPIQH